MFRRLSEIVPETVCGAFPARGGKQNIAEITANIRLCLLHQADYLLQRQLTALEAEFLAEGGSKEMCCMWPTDDPPDIIEGTPPFNDIEDAFGIAGDDDTALELYDMYLDKAAARILEMQRQQGGAEQEDG